MKVATWVVDEVEELRRVMRFELYGVGSNRPAEMLEALQETRREGGLGVLLAHGLSSSTDYAYIFGRNRIRLTLAP